MIINSLALASAGVFSRALGNHVLRSRYGARPELPSGVASAVILLATVARFVPILLPFLLGLLLVDALTARG